MPEGYATGKGALHHGFEIGQRAGLDTGIEGPAIARGNDGHLFIVALSKSPATSVAGSAKCSEQPAPRPGPLRAFGEIRRLIDPWREDGWGKTARYFFSMHRHLKRRITA